jgi:hypothetical protein
MYLYILLIKIVLKYILVCTSIELWKYITVYSGICKYMEVYACL